MEFSYYVCCVTKTNGGCVVDPSISPQESGAEDEGGTESRAATNGSSSHRLLERSSHKPTEGSSHRPPEGLSRRSPEGLSQREKDFAYSRHQRGSSSSSSHDKDRDDKLTNVDSRPSKSSGPPKDEDKNYSRFVSIFT